MTGYVRSHPLTEEALFKLIVVKPFADLNIEVTHLCPQSPKIPCHAFNETVNYVLVILAVTIL